MRIATLLLAVAGCLSLVFSLKSEEQQEKPKPFGIDKRVAWDTSKVKGSPEPPPPFRTEPAFPKLKFYEPLEAVAVPGSDLILVLERKGKIYSFVNDAKTEQAQLVGELGKTAYGLVCHPQFAKNGFIYVTNVLDPEKSEPKGTRVSRFEVQKGKLDLKSEKIIIEWPSGGHNGGCLRFGPDGFLYICTGDGSGIADQFDIGQDVSSIFAKLLRIDVDNPGKGFPAGAPAVNYGIPADNPFVLGPPFDKTKYNARPEVYAYGLRQAWKYSFDRPTGALWAGEVGQDLWEMVYRIEKGGNYGWSVMEGTHPFRPERKKGPTPILKPIVEHPHTDFRSLTGGYVYHGTRLKELTGAYIYGDFDTGRVWAFRYDAQNGKVNDHRELAQTTLRLVGFCEDQKDEVLLIDFMGGQLHRLVPNPTTATGPPFPRKLSETGLFASTKELKPAPGLIPYSVNAQLWSDGAIKERYLALPGNSTIDFDTVTYPQPAPGAPPGWQFPDGTVMVKTFFLDLEKGNPKSRRRLETRLLHYQKLAGTQEYGEDYWRGYTYVWNEDQTDADLLDGKGLDREYTIKDAQAPGGTRKQVWHFPSRNECIGCHTQPAKFTLGVNTRQLNKDHDYGGVVDNQLRTLEHLGVFSKPLPTTPDKLPRLHNDEDPKVDVNLRARSYLHANCAHCHMKWGGGNAEFQLLATMELKELGIVGTRPNHGSFDVKDASVLTPGSPERSLIYQRMSRRGLGQMPHIASNVVDEHGVKLIHDWIKQLK